MAHLWSDAQIYNRKRFSVSQVTSLQPRGSVMETQTSQIYSRSTIVKVNQEGVVAKLLKSFIMVPVHVTFRNEKQVYQKQQQQRLFRSTF